MFPAESLPTVTIMRKIVTVTVFLAAVLAGCGGDDEGRSGPSGPWLSPSPVHTGSHDAGYLSPEVTEPEEEPSTEAEPTRQAESTRKAESTRQAEPLPEPDPEPVVAEDNVVSGRAYDRDGRPLADVMIQFYIQPRTFGGLYRTWTDADGRYAYALPGGVYTVFAQLDNADPNLVLDLEPRQTGPDGVASISVPPGHVIDFDVP